MLSWVQTSVNWTVKHAVIAINLGYLHACSGGILFNYLSSPQLYV